MPLPTWLPPLQTNDGHSVVVTIEQCQPPPNSHSSGFVINVNVLVTYVCEDPRVSPIRLPGLSLLQSFHIPIHDLNTSMPSLVPYSEARIVNMLSHMPVPFSKDRFYWSTSRLDGFVSSNMLGDQTNLPGFILKFLVNMRGAHAQTQSPSEIFSVNLTINKQVVVLKNDFQNWIRWYDLQKRLSPTFENDFVEAISRPWNIDAAFIEALRLRCICPSLNNLMNGEVYQGRDLNDTCPVCLERFGLGSRVARLPCKHIYHGGCIVEWLTNMKDLCALCRSNFAADLFIGSLS